MIGSNTLLHVFSVAVIVTKDCGTVYFKIRTEDDDVMRLI